MFVLSQTVDHKQESGLGALKDTPLTVSEILFPRPQIEFHCPGTAVLMMQNPVGIGDGLDIEEAIGSVLFLKLWGAGKQTFPFNAAVNDGMGHVNALRPELPRKALGQSTQTCLGNREGRVVGLAAQRAAGAGERKRSAAAGKQSGQSRLRDLEATERVLAPVALEILLFQLQERRGPVGTGVLDGDGKRASTSASLTNRATSEALAASPTLNATCAPVAATRSAVSASFASLRPARRTG